MCKVSVKGPILKSITIATLFVFNISLPGFASSGNTPESIMTGTTTLVSVASDGIQANDRADTPTISSDGRFIAFGSRADNLVPSDTNERLDIFVHDRQTGSTTRISVSSDGTQANGNSQYPHISADGSSVAFLSYANNLVPNDTNKEGDLFVHDLDTGLTTRVNVASDGTQGNHSFMSSRAFGISAKGRYVTFESVASNLVSNDINELMDIFVHDRQTGATTRVSESAGGAGTNWGAGNPAISANGRFVVFHSQSTNLVPTPTDFTSHVYIHDRQTGLNELLSRATDGTRGNSTSFNASISDDGFLVAFYSIANNLVADDTNGHGDLFVHNRRTGWTSRVSLSSDGTQSNANSGTTSSLSEDGRYVVFNSFATNLAPNDTNGMTDVFVHDRQTGETSRASEASDGTPSNWSSGDFGLDISATGHAVTFSSSATNLVPEDTTFAEDVYVRILDIPGPPPARPTGIRATDGTFSDRVRVTWNTLSDATVYRVFRCLTNGQTCGLPIGFAKTNTFDDKWGTPGTVYFYRVRACNETGCGLFSVANTGYASTAPAKPTTVRASDGTFSDRVRVTWDEVGGATVYRVFRCLTNGQTCGTPIGYPGSGTFDDKKAVPGTVYFYRVRACNSTSCGLFSAANTGFTRNAPDKPTGIRASDGTFSDRVHITFNTVEGATVYRVFRCLTIGQTCGLPVGYPKTGIFNDRKGNPGTVYYYRVRACNSDSCGLFSAANTGHR